MLIGCWRWTPELMPVSGCDSRQRHHHSSQEGVADDRPNRARCGAVRTDKVHGTRSRETPMGAPDLWFWGARVMAARQVVLKRLLVNGADIGGKGFF